MVQEIGLAVTDTWGFRPPPADPRRPRWQWVVLVGDSAGCGESRPRSEVRLGFVKLGLEADSLPPTRRREQRERQQSLPAIAT